MEDNKRELVALGLETAAEPAMRRAPKPKRPVQTSASATSDAKRRQSERLQKRPAGYYFEPPAPKRHLALPEPVGVQRLHAEARHVVRGQIPDVEGP